MSIKLTLPAQLSQLTTYGPQTDLFLAEQARGIIEVLTADPAGATRSPFNAALSAQHAFAIETFVLAITRLYDHPRKRYQLRSLPAVLRFLEDNAAALNCQQPAFLAQAMERITGAKFDCSQWQTAGFTAHVAGLLQEALPANDDGGPLSRLKALRDKRLAHPEDIDLHKIPKASWEDTDRLIVLAQNLVTALGAFTSTAYMGDDGRYWLSVDAQRAANSWARLLRHPGVLGT